MKTIEANGTTYKFGRKHPPALGLHFKLRNYLLATVPDPPRHVSYAPAASESLSNIFGNDVEGDCGPACAAHIEGVWTDNAGGPLFIPSLAEVNDFYSGVEGPPGFPAIDNGVDEVTLMNYWVSHGFSGRKATAWMAVDATNMHEAKTSLWLFENLVICMYLPDAWVNPFPAGSGFTWNVAGSPVFQNGHMFPAVGYDFRTEGKRGFEIDTWAMLGRMTPGAVSTYCVPAPNIHGGLYTVLSQESINRAQQKAPNGLNWPQLQAAFAAMA